MTAIAVPLLKDKTEAWKSWINEECLGSRKEEFDEFNERMGLTLHRAWLSESPHGPLAIVLFDGPGAETFLQKLATSQEPFDTWFRERVEELHDFDFSQLREMKTSELVLDWRAPSYAETGYEIGY
jgi:hypothetical protein